MGKRTAQRFVKDLLKYALGMSNCGAFVSFEVCFLPFGFDGGVWDLIVLVRDNCHSFNFFGTPMLSLSQGSGHPFSIF